MGVLLTQKAFADQASDNRVCSHVIHSSVLHDVRITVESDTLFDWGCAACSGIFVFRGYKGAWPLTLPLNTPSLRPPV